MKYVKANAVLPESLITEIQKYIQGETIYIPKQETKHYKWGTRSGGRKQLDERNKAIKEAFKKWDCYSSTCRRIFSFWGND